LFIKYHVQTVKYNIYKVLDINVFNANNIIYVNNVKILLNINII